MRQNGRIVQTCSTVDSSTSEGGESHGRRSVMPIAADGFLSIMTKGVRVRARRRLPRVAYTGACIVEGMMYVPQERRADRAQRANRVRLVRR